MTFDSVDDQPTTRTPAEAPLQWGPRLGRAPQPWGLRQVIVLIALFAIGLVFMPIALYLSLPTIHIGDFLHIEGGGSLTDLYHEFGK